MRLITVCALCAAPGFAEGTWTKLTNQALNGFGGHMTLLSDGSVIAKTTSGGTGTGNIWDKLTPDIHGSYQRGTFSRTVPAMANTRLYFSSQLLMDGRLYVAGAEYGTGGTAGEVYDPRKNAWTNTPRPPYLVKDAISEILPDGRVLQSYVGGGGRYNSFWDPKTNVYSTAPSNIGRSNEASWVKLADSSILTVPTRGTASERYIPALNKWVASGTVPVQLYDPYGSETGPAFLLPDGRAFFLGSQGATAYYRPGTGPAPGTWTAGPQIPNAQGTPDAPGAMMANGIILCAVSPVPTSSSHFPAPTSFYEFDYLTDTFTRVKAPNGTNTANGGSYQATLLDLPDGTVLYGRQGSREYYVYTPDGEQVESGKPTVKKVTHAGSNCDSGYTMTGTLFNGISEGAAYGDDVQLNTNYPLARITAGSNTYYVRTFNWNSTGVQRGELPDTTQFTLPPGLPKIEYSLVVSANGIASDPIPFTPSCGITTDLHDAPGLAGPQGFTASVFHSTLSLSFRPGPELTGAGSASLQLTRPDGSVAYREILDGSGAFDREIDLSRHGKGIYLLTFGNGPHRLTRRIVVQ